MKVLEKWLLPPACVITHEPTELYDLSESVLNQLIRPDEVCPRCCEPSVDAQMCGTCITKPPSFDRTQVGYYFAEPISQLIYDLKYHQQSANARLLAEVVADSFDTTNIEALIPVPIHPLRRRKRGYNQAELIAQSLGKLLDIPVLSLDLKRVKDTPSQTHLTAKQRHQNLTKAFQMERADSAKLTRIALIDDVITTGATMQALAKLIQSKTDISHIQAWAVAKTK